MGKKLGGVNWKSVALEGVPLDGGSLNGFVGLEECTDYDLHSNYAGNKTTKKERKRKEVQKRPAIKKCKQNHEEESHNTFSENLELSSKKFKLSHGFIVEECARPIPSTDNEPQKVGKIIKNNLANQIKGVTVSSKLEECNTNVSVDMCAWTNFQVPEEILRALAEQGFEKPTRIQELCLPPAMLGRRDILGAAETGSGKTLAFGIPILAGIMNLKEKEESGQDVYDSKYKKSSVKRKASVEKTKPKKSKKIHSNNHSTVTKTKTNTKYDSNDTNSSKSFSSNVGDLNDDTSTPAVDVKNSEINQNEDDSDGDDNYIHMSDLIDSDALEDSSDEEKDTVVDPNDSDGDINETKSDNSDVSEISDGEGQNHENTADEIGCVKVVDNIDLPAPSVVKTGKPLYGLIITPTRELAMQISKHLTMAAKYTGIRIATIVGGLAQVKQERLLSRSPELVVCTPGRLWQLTRQGERHLQQLDTIKFLAIDETDRMMERNHFEELQPLLERLNADEARRSSRQNFVMSATLTMTHDLPSHMRRKKVTKRGKIINRKLKKMTPQQKTAKLIAMLGMTDPKIVDLTEENKGKADSLTECRITCALDQKDFYLFYILRTHPGRTLVFCNSIGCVKRLAQIFGLLKCRSLPLHAGMPQRQRLKNLERFRDDARGVLIATDVAARGLDIPNVDHVIHYQVPRTAENYVHRSGRTARADKEGLTILMMEPGESFLYSKLCRTLNKTTSLAEFPVAESALAALRPCVSLAREVEAAGLAGKRRAQETGWLERAARECDLIVDEDFVPMKKKTGQRRIGTSCEGAAPQEEETAITSVQTYSPEIFFIQISVPE